MCRQGTWKQQFSVLALIAISLVIVSCFRNLETREPSIELKEAAPDFSLPTHDDQKVNLDLLLAKGPAVVVFYRGYW